MNYEIIVKPTFQREAKRLAKHYSSFKEDFVSLIDDLEQNPLLGTDLGWTAQSSYENNFKRKR